MKKMSAFWMAVALAAGLGVAAGVQDKKAAAGPAIIVSFGSVDTDRDRRISKAEWEALFAKLDTDKDGFLSEQEFAAAAPKKKDGGK